MTKLQRAVTRATLPPRRVMSLACVIAAGAVSMGLAAPAPAPAPASAGFHFGQSSAPIDVSANHQELFQSERRLVYLGEVEVVQGQTRLRTPQLTILYAPKAGAPGAPAPAAGGSGFGQIQHMEAEGPVYLVTATQSAKGDHGTYEATTDTITLIGNVTLLQDKNVATGDKLVIEQSTGHSVMSMNGPAQRVRGVFYSQQAAAAPAPAPPAAPPGPAPAPAKVKPAKPAKP